MTRGTHRYFSSMVATFVCISIGYYKGFWQGVNSYFFYLIPFSFAMANLPDIDHPKSGIGKIFKRISLRVYNKFGHRGFTHSLLGMGYAVAIFSILVSIFTDRLYLILFFCIAYGSHLLADMCTISGIPLFYPFTNKRYKIMKIRTGSDTEYFIKDIIKIFSPVYLFSLLWRWAIKDVNRSFK